MHPNVTITEVTDPEEIAKARVQCEKFERNLAWLAEHATEVYSHRGKVICIAGQELFVADTAEEVLALAKAAHPEDEGRFTRIIPKKKVPRIYGNRWCVATV
jgi:hypothetical protein